MLLVIPVFLRYPQRTRQTSSKATAFEGKIEGSSFRLFFGHLCLCSAPFPISNYATTKCLLLCSKITHVYEQSVAVVGSFPSELIELTSSSDFATSYCLQGGKSVSEPAVQLLLAATA
jgi:hypothetical protein